MKLIIRCLLIFGVLSVAILVFEVASRFSYESYANYNTEMWRYASTLKQLSPFPGLGHEHRPNSKAHLYGVELATNRLGFRSHHEVTTPKPEGIRRVLVLGDSITLGWGVPYEETYPYVLEKLINVNSEEKYEVINTGVGNYNSASERAALKKFLPIVDPDIVVLGFYINDIEEVKYPSAFTYWLTSHSYFYGLLSDRWINLSFNRKSSYRTFYDRLYRNKRLVSRLQRDLTDIISTVEAEGLPFILVNIPEFHQFENYPFPEAHLIVETAANQFWKTTYVDLLPYLVAHHPTKLWVSPEDHHPNGLGQRIIAQAIFDRWSEVSYEPIKVANFKP